MIAHDHRLFNLKGVRVNLHFLDVVNRWHVLFLVLLILLLLSKHLELEELEPTLVAKVLRAKLNHFAVDHVVGGDVFDQLGVQRLDICNHHEVCIDPLGNLLQVEVTVLKRGLVVEARAVPVAPRFRLSLRNEVPEVSVEAIAHIFEQSKLSLRLYIRLYGDSLGAVNHIFRHAHLQTILDDVVVEPPGVEINLSVQLISVSLLQGLYSPYFYTFLCRYLDSLGA